jgi:signal transduction histidine kinase
VKTFTFRLTCRFVCLTTATTAAVLVVAGILLDREVERGLELLHAIEVRELTELIGTDPSLGPAQIHDRIKHDTDSDAALFLIQVARSDGSVLFRSDNLGATILAAPPNGDHWTMTLPALGRVHLSAFEIEPWQIIIGSPLEPSERLLKEYLRIGVRLLVGVVLLSIGLGYAFSRATLRPIRTIATTADRIRADRLSERIPVPPGRDELSSLAVLLNQMFDRLEASFTQIQRFTADVSHELKTPLSLVRLNAEKLRQRVPHDSEAGIAAEDILEELARLHAVIDRLLFLAKSEGGALPLVRQSIAMHDLVSSFAEDARALAEDRELRFVVSANEPGEILGDAGLVRQILLNLVANAVAASPPGGLIELASAPSPTGWQLVLTDEGPGIPAAELARLFQRFRRVERAASGVAEIAGHGLGLAICKSIVDLHQGRIEIENRTERSGLRVIVTLPIPIDEGARSTKQIAPVLPEVAP